jgi:hypothetical protein
MEYETVRDGVRTFEWVMEEEGFRTPTSITWGWWQHVVLERSAQEDRARFSR